jgi:phage shock protein B
MSEDAVIALSVGLPAIICLFVVLPWMILHYISKARSSGALSEEDGRMLEDLWRSAKTMERRIETMERLLEPEGTVIRPRPSTTSRGDMN